MDDDGLEVIDLTLEPDDERPRPPREFRFSRSHAVAGVALVVVVAVGAVLVAHHQSGHKTDAAPVTSSSIVRPIAVPTTTTWAAPPGLARLAPGRFVAVVFGTPVLVIAPGSERQLLPDITGNALAGVSQRGGVLLHYPSTTRVIVGPDFEGTRNVLPAAITLLPDADGDWWSDFGSLDRSHELHQVRFPGGTTPVAKIRGGYLLVSNGSGALYEWRSDGSLQRIGVGNPRVLAVAGDLVAWTNDVDLLVHVSNVATGRERSIEMGGLSAVTARFSPDGSRLAMLTGSVITESMVLANITTGRLLTEVVTASGGNGLAAFTDVPPAFEPVPFSWAANGRLVVITQTNVGYFVKTIDASTGAELDTVDAPEGLQQLVFLTR